MNQLKTMHSFVKLLRKKCGAPSIYRGTAMHPDDRKVVRDAFMLWFCVLRDRCVEDLGCYSNEKRILHLSTTIGEIDLFEFMKQLDFCADALLQSVEHASLRDYQQLKAAVAQEIPNASLIRGVLGVLKPHLLNWFRSQDRNSFARASECLRFLSRLNLAEQIELADTAFEQWHDSEKSCAIKREYDDDKKRIIEEWFPLENTAILAEGFNPRHGPGKVAEGTSETGAKALLNGYDENLFAVYIAMGWDPDFRGLMQCPYFTDGAGRHPMIPGNSHVISAVPKNWKVKRIVSAERAAYQFMQLGASDAIKHYLKSGICSFSQHYCVDTDDYNRKLAQLGSIDGSFATIDLSAASDSISNELVQQWFGDSCLGVFTRRLRTPFAQFDLEISGFEGEDRVRDTLKVHKFAPMGSGICFPIESITFGAFAESAVRRTRGASRRWAVFGDDIVIDTKAVPLLMDDLTRHGLTVNKTKSFYNTSFDDSHDFFRESCGGEYLNGTDVTPCRISRKFRGFLDVSSRHRGRLDPRSIARLISLANDLYDLRTARILVIEDLLAADVPVLFDQDGRRGIKSPTPNNHHLRRRYNVALQRWEVYAAQLIVKRKKLDYHEDNYLGEVRLFEYLRLAESSHRKSLLYPEDMVSERMDPYSSDIRVTYQWVEPPDDLQSTD